MEQNGFENYLKQTPVSVGFVASISLALVISCEDICNLPHFSPLLSTVKYISLTNAQILKFPYLCCLDILLHIVSAFIVSMLPAT